MIGAGAVQVFPVSRFANAETLLGLLSTGGTISGRVVADGAGLALALPQFRIPLPKDAPLSPGVLVDVRIVEENGVKQVQLRPVPPNPVTSAPPSASAAAALLSEVVARLSASITPEQAALLLPKAEGLPKETLRGLLDMLVGRERLGAVVAQLSEAIEAAVTSGRLPTGIRDQLAALVDRLLAHDAAEFERAIAQARETLRGRAGATSLQAAESGDTLPDELMALREQVASRGRGGPQIEQVLRAIDALVERIDSGRIQNVRGFEAPYQFLEVPLSNRTGFDRAQIHVFGDGSNRSDGRPGAHSVVLDLELSRLGPVWIALHSTGDVCSCVMHVASEPARQTLTESSPALEEALRAAGYDRAAVRTEAWDGDRLSALTAMSSRFAGFEARA